MELQPLCAAAHRALGLVAEARGDAAEAARELELALELTLSDEPHQGMCSLSSLMLFFALDLMQASLLSRWKCGLAFLHCSDLMCGAKGCGIVSVCV